MRTLYLAITLCLLFAARAASAQAAAESVLLNGSSATGTAKIGSSLGNALNKATTHTSDKVHTTGRPKPVVAAVAIEVERKPVAKPAATAAVESAAAAPTGTSTSMIVSVQGGRITRAKPTAPEPPAVESKEPEK